MLTARRTGGMLSLDVPRVTYVVAFLLFATGIGHVLVTGEASSHIKNLLYNPPMTIEAEGLEAESVSCTGKVFDENVPEGKLCYKLDREGSIGVTSTVQHSPACPDTNGHVLVLLLGDSTLRNKYEYVKRTNGSHEVSPRCVQCGMTVCYASHTVLNKAGLTGQLIKEILAELPSLSNYTVSVPIVNFGLHHLHLSPARKVFVSSIPEFERVLREDVVLTSRAFDEFRQLSHATYFKLINHVCTDNFIGKYAETITRWKEPDTADSIRKECHISVQRELNITFSDAAAVCDRLTFDNVGVETINNIALEVARLSPHLHVIDDRKLTRDQCACSKVSDGRHYFPLVPLWWQSFQEVIRDCVMQQRGRT